MKCGNCKVDYPEEILNYLDLNGKLVRDCCGICALELSNKLHGFDRKQFTGEMAERFRMQAIEHRRITGQEPL